MNATIVRLAAQSLLGRRRGLLLLALPALLIALAGLLRALAGSTVGYDVVSGLGYTLALPLVALLAASAVLGPEVDDGSIVYLLAKPVNRYAVGLSKYVVALLATWVAGALPLGIAGAIIDAGDLDRSVAWLVGGLLAGAAYTALFLALAALTRHAVVIGLLFVLLWEGLLGGLLGGIKWLSIGAWGTELAGSISDLIPRPGTGVVYAIVAGLVVVAGGLWLTGDRLRSFSMRGET